MLAHAERQSGHSIGSQAGHQRLCTRGTADLFDLHLKWGLRIRMFWLRFQTIQNYPERTVRRQYERNNCDQTDEK